MGLAKVQADFSRRLPGWWHGLRLFLGLLWLVHALEKFGVRWPGFLHGGTGDVAAMLDEVAAGTPLRLVQGLVAGVLAPAGAAFHWFVALAELAVALVLLLGALPGSPARLPARLPLRLPAWLLPWALAGGAGIQAFLWLGFLAVDWPFQYPVIIFSHLALLAVLLGPARAPAALAGLRLLLGALWLTEAAAGRLPWWAAGPLAASLLAGALAPGGAVAGAAVALAWGLPREAWGSWPWSYYAVAAAHLALLGGAGKK